MLNLVATELKRLIHSAFVRNVAVVAMGAAGSQAITMAFTPFITRLYGPEAFGVSGTFTALLAVATPFAALTFPIAIVLPKSDLDAQGLAKLSLIITSLVAGLVFSLVFVVGEEIVSTGSLDLSAGLLYLLPLAMIFSGLEQVLGQWSIRKKMFKMSSCAGVLHSATLGCAKVGFGWLHPVPATLVTLTAAGHGLHALLLWLGVRTTATRNITGRLDLGNLLRLAQRHRDFPLFRAPQVALNAISQGLPVLMLATLFGPAAAGFYSLSRTAMGIPSTLIGKSVGDVFYPKIAEAVQKREEPARLILRATLALSALGFAPFLLVALFGPWIFVLVFGPDWAVAGRYARWLAIWLFFGFVNRPSVTAIAALGLQGIFLAYEVISVALRAAALYVGFVAFGSDLAAVAIFSLVGVVLNAWLVVYTLHRSRRRFPG